VPAPSSRDPEAGREPSTTPSTTPSRIAQHGPRQLAIDWADGASSLYDVRLLRLACGCAACVDEWSGEELLDPDSVPEDVHPLKIESVGRYAIQIEWSDGHASGIYPFRRLRELDARGDTSR
jgi:ATP-binding protein involved in chromosome partitioning